MKTPLVTIVLATMALATSGCFGYPAGTARPGSQVEFIYDSSDAQSGQVVGEPCFASETIGSGQTDRELQQALVGHKSGDVVLTSLASLQGVSCQAVIQVSEKFDSFPAISSAPRAPFEAAVKQPAVVGGTFALPNALNVTVTGLNATSVDYRFVSGQHSRQHGFGIDLVYVDGDGSNMTVLLLPNGSHEVFDGPVPAVGLGAGRFSAVGLRDHNVMFATATSHPLPASGAVIVKMTILSIGAGDLPAPSGNYGQRWGGLGTTSHNATLAP